MKVLVTGSDGYIGTVLVDRLIRAGHEVHGMDSLWFRDCVFGPVNGPACPVSAKDMREVHQFDLSGFDAVCHLASLCNDPLGNMNPELTEEINERASIRIAQYAAAAGVRRFVFSSSCSLYGASYGDFADEDAPLDPLTPYAVAKLRVEHALKNMARPDFSPVILRNATAYGISPKLRLDLVVNNLAACAFTRRKILLESDGTPWRPIVHVEDIADAFVAALDAPVEQVHARVFNVGSTADNYQVLDIAEAIRDALGNCEIELAPKAGPDRRTYRVNCDRICGGLDGYRPRWTLKTGINQLLDAFATHGLDEAQFRSPRYYRLAAIRERQARGELDQHLYTAEMVA